MAAADFERINAEIRNVEASITSLENKVRQLNQSMETTGNIQMLIKFKEELKKISAELESQKNKRIELISEKNLLPLQSTLKTIDTLKAKLEELRTTRGSATGDSFKLVESEIKKAENALKSFESRLKNQELAIQGGRFKGMPSQVSGILGEEARPPSATARPLDLVTTGNLQTLRNSLEKEAKQNLTDAELRRIAERQRIEALRKTIAAEEKYARAVEVAAQQGYSLSNLTDVRTRGTGGIEQLRFQRQGSLGENRQLDLFVNQAGRATPGISNQFRTFGQGIARDIGELTKWSIALAAIYGPMRKLGELTETMIENQTRLAEAAISVSSSFADQGDIFSAAADAANKAGEEISGVIDAFTQAYRATGGAGNQIERFATANTLLADALTLSKLSTLDQATAIDTLAAALRQSASALDSQLNPLEQGTTLLDKWVRVTKVANVDLTTLATGFAVLGDAAEAAGIGVDELNGIIAAIAETGIASARESANVARALVSGFQSDQARAALESLGIAVEDTTGQMRPFLEIMQEISSLRNLGVIDDTQFSRLTLALGGGTRRQAAYATFIENFGRVSEVAGESARAGGDAQQALAKQLETVQTSLTRLGNAFEEWAQTLGTEGGFLSIITNSIDFLTEMVNLFEDLTSLLGKATPALVAFGAAAAVLKYQGVQGGLQGVLGGAFGGQANTALNLRLSQLNPQAFAGAGSQNFLSQNVLGTNWISGAIQGALVTAIPAYMNATNEQDRFGGVKAVGNVIGGVGGGIVGALVAQSPIIGAAVGTAISEAFVNSTIARKTDIFAYATPTQLGPAGAGPAPVDDLDEALRRAEIRLYESVGFGSEIIGRILTSSGEDMARRIEEVNEAIAARDEKRFQRLTTGVEAGTNLNLPLAFGQAGVSQEMLRQAFQQNRQIQFTPESMAYQRASPQAQAEYDRALTARTAVGDIDQIDTVFSRMVQQNQQQYGDLLAAIREQSRNQLTSQRITGDVKGADYARRVQALGGFDTKALQYYTAIGDELVRASDYAEDAEDAFRIFNEIIVSGASDSVPEITQIVTEIEELVNLLEDPALNEQRIADAFGGVDQAEAKLQQLRQTGAALINDIYQQSLLGQTQIPDIRGQISEPRTKKEENLIYEEGLRLQEEFLTSLGLTADEMDAFVDSLEEYAVRVSEGGNTFYEVFAGLAEQFRAAAEQALESSGDITSASGQQGGIGFQQFDFTRAQIESAAARSLQIGAQWQAAFGYSFEPETQVAVDSSGFAEPLRADFRIMQMLLQELVDQGQKQLDGQYNIPEGATFWVPLTAAYYRRSPDSGGAGLGGIGGPAVESNTSATEQNTRALANLTERLTRMETLTQESFEGTPLQDPKTREESLRDKVLEDKTFQTGMSDRQLLNKILEDRTYVKPQEDTTGILPLLESTLGGLGEELRSIFNDITNSIRDAFTNPFGAPSGGDAGPTGAATQPVATKLDLRIDSSTALIVDGRTLANVVKPYLEQDLLRTQQTQGVITRNFVI